MEVYLIRHTTPDIEKGVCYGQSDLPVKETFEKEVNTIIGLLPENPDILYTSPLIRCACLMDRIYPGAANIKDIRLKEINFGAWELMKWDEIPLHELQPWMSDYINQCPPNGESLNQLLIRVKSFMADLYSSNGNKIVVSTHSGVIRCMLGLILEMPLTNIFKIGLNYGTVTKLRITEKTISVEYVNAGAHY